jgi:hypothetical protein
MDVSGIATVHNDAAARRLAADRGGGAGDKTRCTHPIENIICYYWPLAPYRVGIYLPRGLLSGLGTRCNYPNLSYKMLG